MRRIAISLSVCLLAASLAARAAVKTQDVTLPSGGESIAAYLAVPEGAGKHPAVVVVHEWWGLTDWVKEQTRNLAGQGYVALAVDLYRGQVAYDPSLAYELAHSMPEDRAVGDLKAAFDFLAARADVNKDKIGAVGWCMGGSLALQLAENEPHLAACVVYYGTLPTDAAMLQKIQAPLLGNFGADDRNIPPAAVEAFESAMKDAKKSVDIKIYRGAGHAFANPNNKLGYQEDAAADAWKRTLAFLAHLLK